MFQVSGSFGSHLVQIAHFKMRVLRPRPHTPVVCEDQGLLLPGPHSPSCTKQGSWEGTPLLSGTAGLEFGGMDSSCRERDPQGWAEHLPGHPERLSSDAWEYLPSAGAVVFLWDFRQEDPGGPGGEAEEAGGGV